MAIIYRLKEANYKGMYPQKWPDIHPDDAKIYQRLYASLAKALWMSSRERAEAHRLLHYLLERS
jgi:hypothetical protein